MHIAFILPSLDTKAPVMVILRIAYAMSRSGHAVTILYFDEIVRIKMPPNVNAERIVFTQKVDFRRFDIVHSSLFRPDLYVFLRKRIRCRTAFVTTIHSYIYQDLKSTYSRWIASLFFLVWITLWLRMDCLVTLSRHAEKYYRGRCLFRKIRHIYNGVPEINTECELPESYRKSIERLRLRTRSLIGTYCVVGRIKNIDSAIWFLKRNDGFGLVLIGDGPDRARLENLAVALSVSDRCLFLAAVPEAHRLNKYIDVFLMLSKAEGFGLSLIEAANYRARIVCSDIPVFHEIFNDHQVTYFHLGDPESLDSAIRDAIADVGQKAENAMHRARTEYTIDSMTRKYSNLYEELLRRKHPRRR
jgi:glycosyltransferase involved in cell wall biosynthesis